MAGLAHAEEPGHAFNIPAVRVETPPTIDAAFDEAAWEAAPKVTGFTNTRDGQPEPTPTFARVLYDDDFLYFALEMIQDPKTIVATVRKYDRFELRIEDYIQVWLDTFHDHRTAYTFLVSPLGTRWDSRDGLYDRNVSWDSEWPAAAKILDDRWVVEMAIPIGDMLFTRGENVTWGINFRRQAPQLRNNSHWSFSPGASITEFGFGPKVVADFGTLTGLNLGNVKVNRHPQVETYVSGTFVQPEGGDLSRKGSTGLDLTLRLNSHWVSTFTVNPDFGQVEADADTIELLDVERFLPERRPFFNDGAELFQSPINIYNSRRILDIEEAAKITGEGGTWSTGILALRGESTQSGEADFLVARYTQHVGERTQLGGMWVSADREGGYNWVGGPDLRIELTPSVSWTSQYLYTQDKDTIIVVDDRGFEDEVIVREAGHAFESGIEGGTKPFFWELQFHDISADFDPDLGFITRKDIVGPTLMANYSKELGEGPIREIEAGTFFSYFQNHDGEIVLRDYYGEAGADLANKLDIEFSRGEFFRRPFSNRETRVQISYNRRDRLKSIETSWSWGVFQEVPYNAFEIEKPFGIGDRFTGSVELDYRIEAQETGDEDIWLLRLESEYTWAWEGRVKLTLEESSEERHNHTLLFAYEDVGDWDFYLVLNDAQTGDQKIRGIFTKFVYRF